MTTPPISVVVPVYTGYEDARRCLESILRHRRASETTLEILVIDDASPDPALRAYVAELASESAAESMRVLRNDSNLGFVKTCNRAFSETAGDVVLLNSDTVVTAGWLDRLAAAARAPDVATVTPLTNFGSICTLPPPIIDAFDLGGPDPRIDECAAFVSVHSVQRRPEVISGVGFCLYVTRSALDAIGFFDEEAFGVGYGEEVDFCLRASSAGFRHVVEDSTFVYHRGAGSFNDRRQELLRVSSETLHRRYPYFRTMNQRERADDPLRVPFAALELGLDDRKSTRPHVLQVLHSKPGELGGTEKHVWSLMGALSGDFDVSVFQPSDRGFLLTTMWRTERSPLATHEFLVPGRPGAAPGVDDPAAAAALETVLDMFEFDAVHIQNIVHHSLAPLAVLAGFRGPVSCSVRDLYLACPHHWLLYRNTQSCGIPEDLSYCATCLPETRDLDVGYLETFRRTVTERLETVDHWVFATQSAIDFFLRVYDVDPDRIRIIEHGAIVDHERSVRRVDERKVLEEPLRIAFVGIGWSKKGLPALNELADELRGSSVEFHHFGELREAISPNVHVHGTYDNAVLAELLDRAGIHVVLFPGPFIETFSHVLTEAMIAGLPVIGSRWGALGERIRRHEIGWTSDPEDVPAMRDLIERLDRCRLEVLRATRRAVAVPLRSVADTAEEYAALYRTDGTRPKTSPPKTKRSDMGDKERLQRELRAMAHLNRQLDAQLSATKQQTVSKARTSTPSRTSRLRRVRAVIVRRGVLGTTREAYHRLARNARRMLR